MNLNKSKSAGITAFLPIFQAKTLTAFPTINWPEMGVLAYITQWAQPRRKNPEGGYITAYKEYKGRIFYWFSYKAAAENLPALGRIYNGKRLVSTRTIRNHFKSLVEQKAIIPHPENRGSGKAYFALSDRLLEMQTESIELAIYHEKTAPKTADEYQRQKNSVEINGKKEAFSTAKKERSQRQKNATYNKKGLKGKDNKEKRGRWPLVFSSIFEDLSCWDKFQHLKPPSGNWMKKVSGQIEKNDIENILNKILAYENKSPGYLKSKKMFAPIFNQFKKDYVKRAPAEILQAFRVVSRNLFEEPVTVPPGSHLNKKLAELHSLILAELSSAGENPTREQLKDLLFAFFSNLPKSYKKSAANFNPSFMVANFPALIVDAKRTGRKAKKESPSNSKSNLWNQL